MMISRAQVQRVLATSRGGGGPQPAAPGSARARAGRRWGAAHLAAVLFGPDSAAEPFYRFGRVAALRRRIATGRYNVSSEEIADKLLGRLLVDRASA